MAKVTYASLNLKTNTNVKTFDFNGKQIEVLQYLPIDDKYSLINITLQEAKEGSIYHPVKKDMYFHLNLVFMYTNITFTEKQREDLNKLYDTICGNGLLEKILENIDEDEYNLLYSYLIEQEENLLKYENTIAATIKHIIEELPLQAEQMQEIVDTFDKNKFQEVLNFAKEANNGRAVEK